MHAKQYHSSLQLSLHLVDINGHGLSIFHFRSQEHTEN